MKFYDSSNLDQSLIKAVLESNLVMVHALLGFGADPNVWYEGKPLLWFAARESTTEIIEALVHAGAELDIEYAQVIPFGMQIS